MPWQAPGRLVVFLGIGPDTGCGSSGEGGVFSPSPTGGIATNVTVTVVVVAVVGFGFTPTLATGLEERPFGLKS